MNNFRWTMAILFGLILTGCGSDEPAESENKTVERATKITVTKTESRDVEVVERALGRISDPIGATIAAEVPARVVSVNVDAGDAVTAGQLLAELDDADTRTALTAATADLQRIQAQHEAQQKLVERYRQMIEQHFVSPTMLEQAESQLAALTQGVDAARAKQTQARNMQQRTKIVAPVAGHVQSRMASPGDFIGVGKPIFTITGGKRLSVVIPLPETRTFAIRTGQKVRLQIPGENEWLTNEIVELTPMIGRNNAFEARIDLDNPGNWRPGASIRAEIVVDLHHNAVVAPQSAVVLRPAGEVVYRIDGDRASAVAVTSGERIGDMVELVDGPENDVVIAAEGASYLSDGALVEVVDESGGGSK